MRSISLKAGLAAAIVSLSLANAFAAGAVAPTTDSPRETAPITEQQRRIGVVLEQLGSTVDGIKMEQKDQNISTADAAKFEKDVSGIRKDAERIAGKNDGKIPVSDYHALLARMDDLQNSSKTGLQDPN